MNEFFKEDVFKQVLSFLDDLLVNSQTPLEDSEHLNKVL